MCLCVAVESLAPGESFYILALAWARAQTTDRRATTDGRNTAPLATLLRSRALAAHALNDLADDARSQLQKLAGIFHSPVWFPVSGLCAFLLECLRVRVSSRSIGTELGRRQWSRAPSAICASRRWRPSRRASLSLCACVFVSELARLGGGTNGLQPGGELGGAKLMAKGVHAPGKSGQIRRLRFKILALSLSFSARPKTRMTRPKAACRYCVTPTGGQLPSHRSGAGRLERALAYRATSWLFRPATKADGRTGLSSKGPVCA